MGKSIASAIPRGPTACYNRGGPYAQSLTRPGQGGPGWTSPTISNRAPGARIAWYIAVEQALVATGTQMLLTPAPPLDGTGDWAAVWYVASDRARAALIAFRLAGSAAARTFVLPGLDPEAIYQVHPMDGQPARLPGAALGPACP